MAIRTKTQFKALYGSSGTLFPDNNTAEISEGDVRAFGEDIADSFSNNQWRGAYDLSVNAYPSSGGTGASGVPAAGDTWYVSVAGDVDVTGLGTITLNPDAILIYKGGDATLAASWIVKQ
jgi:hypothetical protein